jgi:hypothetical protein
MNNRTIKERKLFTPIGLIALLALTLIFFACSSDDYGESKDSLPTPSLKTTHHGNFGTPVSAAAFKPSKVDYWVKGSSCTSKPSKCDTAVAIFQWNDAPKGIPDNLVYGYLFKAADSVSGADMIQDITKADKRFYLLSQTTTTTNTEAPFNTITSLTVGGIGFTLHNSLKLIRGGNLPPPDTINNPPIFNPQNPLISPDNWGFFTPLVPYDDFSVTYDTITFPPPGSITADTTWFVSNYDYDWWTCPDSLTAYCGPLTHWKSGWYNGYWAYDTTDTRKIANFTYSEVGASYRILKNGSYDFWYFDDIAVWGWNTPPLPSTLTPVHDPEDDDDD